MDEGEVETDEAPKKSMASPGSVMGANSQVNRILEGKTTGHQNVKLASMEVEESSRDESEGEEVAWTGPSGIQLATSDSELRAL